MDTDGYVDVFGRCDLTTIREHLAESAFELVASLGFRPTLAKKRATLYGVDCGPKYEVQFTPDRPVFRLSRKVARQKTVGRFHRFRGIAAVREVPSVPVRCIEVAWMQQRSNYQSPGADRGLAAARWASPRRRQKACCVTCSVT